MTPQSMRDMKEQSKLISKVSALRSGEIEWGFVEGRGKSLTRNPLCFNSPVRSSLERRRKHVLWCYSQRRRWASWTHLPLLNPWNSKDSLLWPPPFIRWIYPHLSPRIYLSFPFPSISVRTWFGSSRLNSGSTFRSKTPLVGVRNQVSLDSRRAFWKGRELLERSSLDANELLDLGCLEEGESTVRRLDLKTRHWPSSLLLSLFKTYAAQPGPYQAKAQKIYDQLRDNLIKNVHKVCCPISCCLRVHCWSRIPLLPTSPLCLLRISYLSYLPSTSNRNTSEQGMLGSSTTRWLETVRDRSRSQVGLLWWPLSWRRSTRSQYASFQVI